MYLLWVRKAGPSFKIPCKQVFTNTVEASIHQFFRRNVRRKSNITAFNCYAHMTEITRCHKTYWAPHMKKLRPALLHHFTAVLYTPYYYLYAFLPPQDKASMFQGIFASQLLFLAI